MLTRSCYLGCMRVASPQEKYLNEVFGLHDAELDALRARMIADGKDELSLAGNEARILQFLIRGFRVRSVVEFGTLYGHSALAMAKALPVDGQVITLESDSRHFAQAMENFKQSPFQSRITALKGDALLLMNALSTQGPFDMVFIDANKTAYLDYLNWADANVRTGGLIVGDNTFLWGGVWGDSRNVKVGPTQVETMGEFNRRLADPLKYNSILIPTVEGLTVAQKL